MLDPPPPPPHLKAYGVVSWSKFHSSADITDNYTYRELIENSRLWLDWAESVSKLKETKDEEQIFVYFLLLLGKKLISSTVKWN